MKKTLKLGFVAILAVIAVAFGALTASLFNPKKAYAADNNFNMVAGASVRLSDENRGIRFTAEFSKDFLDEEAAYRMMIIPADWLTKYSLTAGADYYKTLVEDNNLTNVAVMNCTPFVYGENYRIQGSLTDIQEKNLNRKWFGIAYREKDNARVYADFNDGENQRSICEVAGAALNDLTENYSEDSKTYLTNQVLNTYKKVSGNSEATMDNVKSLYTITNNNTNFLITKGDSKELSYTLTATDNTIADKLGLKLGYYSDNGELMTVADDGTVTASSENSGMVTVGAVLLGEKVTDKAVKAMVRSEMAGNMLEDYADECSAKPFGSDKQMWINGGGVSGATSWLETYEGRNGIIKLKSATTANTNDIRFFYNRSYEEMISLDFDYISIWAYFDKDGTFDIKNGTVVLGTNIEGKTWTELRLNKDDISKTHGSYEKFCARHDPAVNRSDIAANNGTKLFSTETEGETVYIDSVSFVKFSVSDYTVPNGGEEFLLPTVKLLDYNGKELNADCNISVTLYHSTNSSVKLISSNVAVVDGKIRIHSGTYTVSYTFEYNGETFVKEIKITGKTAALANDALEDFDDPSRIKNLEPWNRGAATVEWLEYYEGKYGIAHATNSKDSGLSLRFDKTVDELKNLDFDYINVTIWVNSPSTSLVIKNGTYQLGVIKGKEWQTITLTKDMIVNDATCWYNSDQINKDNGGGMDAFAYRHSVSSGQNGYYLFSFPWSGIEYYIDSISFGKNA